MKLEQVKNLKLPTRKCIDPEYLTRTTPEGMPKLNFLAVLYGAMGSGKSVALYDILDMYDASHSYDRIIWYSPTMCRDVNGMDYLNRKHNFELVYHDAFEITEFQQHLLGMKTDIDNYREYKRRLQIWEKLIRNDYDVNRMKFDDLLVLEEMNWEKPTTEFKNGFPSFAVVWDDCITDKVFSQNIKNPVARFLTTHRQHSCCVFITSQVHQQGVPRQIRGVVSLWILFRCKSKELQEQVAKELSFKCPPEILMKVWDFATRDDPHDFLFVNYTENDMNDMFRKNFTHRVCLDDIQVQPLNKK